MLKSERNIIWLVVVNSLLIITFKYFDISIVRLICRMIIVFGLPYFLLQELGLKRVFKHKYLLIGVFANLTVLSFFDSFQKLDLLTFAELLLLLTKLLMLYQIYNYPNRRKQKINNIFYYIIPLSIGLICDYVFLIDGLEPSVIALAIIISVLNPLVFSLTLLLNDGNGSRPFFIAALAISAIVELWEAQVHFIAGGHEPFNPLPILNLIPYIFIIIAVYKMENPKSLLNKHK